MTWYDSFCTLVDTPKLLCACRSCSKNALGVQLAISWPKIGVKKHLKLQNYSNEYYYEPSKTAINMTYSRISRQKGIIRGLPDEMVRCFLEVNII